MNIKAKKVLVGMSGGVDSSAAALILLQQGASVCGCTILPADDTGIIDAKRVCQTLGIEHRILDLTDKFRKCVKEPFVKGYINGETPNPCIFCNNSIKFGAMLEYAEKEGFDHIATGHYAGISYNEESGKYRLLRAADRNKDQSYVLYGLTQHKLAHTLFPLYGMTKDEIRAAAEAHGLVNAHRRDSQDICFIPDGDHTAFIKSFTGQEFPKGNFIDPEGNVIGTHQGIISYTIGQRRGLGAAFGKPVYVTKKDLVSNTVTLGSLSDLMKNELYLADVNIISGETLSAPIEAAARVRYSAKEQDAVIYPIENGLTRVVFKSPVKAPAPGQACVFYMGDEVVGGGRIFRS